MKIVGFEAEGGVRLGIVEGDQVIDMQAADPKLPANLADVLAVNNGDLKVLGDAAKKAPASARRPLNGLKFGLPVARPGKIICMGLNYLDHVKEGPNRDNIPKFPSIFMRGLTSMVPHEQPIIRPKASEQLDYEAEMMLIVGKRAKHLTLANATSCIAGYSCGNEGSVREFQRKSTQWDMGKNFDRTGGFGPWMVTADELPVPEMLVYITQGMTLEPGDIIFTGTPSGVGHARKPNPIWMKNGDVCEIEIEGIGSLRNPIQDEA
jgi:2-keto-4-pentenoate hydratase/2-oxohepta-3-ene-1,7-dioic acid hydratase in catechol pathway